MKFKELELDQEPNWFKKTIRSRQTRKTIIYVVVGAILSFLLFYITDGRHQDVIKTNDIINNMLIGGLFGAFITNSPCARNRC